MTGESWSRWLELTDTDGRNCLIRSTQIRFIRDYGDHRRVMLSNPGEFVPVKDELPDIIEVMEREIR